MGPGPSPSGVWCTEPAIPPRDPRRALGSGLLFPRVVSFTGSIQNRVFSQAGPEPFKGSHSPSSPTQAPSRNAGRSGAFLDSAGSSRSLLGCRRIMGYAWGFGGTHRGNTTSLRLGSERRLRKASVRKFDRISGPPTSRVATASGTQAIPSPDQRHRCPGRPPAIPPARLESARAEGPTSKFGIQVSQAEVPEPGDPGIAGSRGQCQCPPGDRH